MSGAALGAARCTPAHCLLCAHWRGSNARAFLQTRPPSGLLQSAALPQLRRPPAPGLGSHSRARRRAARRYIERSIGGGTFHVGEDFLDLTWHDGHLDYNQDQGEGLGAGARAGAPLPGQAAQHSAQLGGVPKRLVGGAPRRGALEHAPAAAGPGLSARGLGGGLATAGASNLLRQGRRHCNPPFAALNVRCPARLPAPALQPARSWPTLPTRRSTPPCLTL